jgi:hypothetical protein
LGPSWCLFVYARVKRLKKLRKYVYIVAFWGVRGSAPDSALSLSLSRLLRRYGYPSILAESQNQLCRLELERNRLRTRYDNSPILTLNQKICRANALVLRSDQNSQMQALTTDHETWPCIHVFLNAYRKTSPAPCLATFSPPCKQYAWHDWTCNSSQFTMQQLQRFMHESFLCVMVVVVSRVCCTNTLTN